MPRYEHWRILHLYILISKQWCHKKGIFQTKRDQCTLHESLDSLHTNTAPCYFWHNDYKKPAPTAANNNNKNRNSLLKCTIHLYPPCSTPALMTPWGAIPPHAPVVTSQWHPSDIPVTSPVWHPPCDTATFSLTYNYGVLTWVSSRKTPKPLINLPCWNNLYLYLELLLTRGDTNDKKLGQ